MTITEVSKKYKISAGGTVVVNNKIHWYEAEMLYDGKTVPISYEFVKNTFKDKYNIVKLSLGKIFSGGEISESGVTKSAGMKVILDYFKCAQHGQQLSGESPLWAW